MSSKAKRIEEKSKKEIDPLYNSLIGSIICTIGITIGRKEKECRDLFSTLKKNPQVLGNTVSDIVNYIWTIFGNNDYKSVRSKYVLLFDKNDVRTPLVTFVNDEGNIMPIDPKGFRDTNIIYLAAEDKGRDWIDYEFLFDENGNSLGIEEEVE